MIDWYAALGPLLRGLDPETAHRLAIRALAAGIVPSPPSIDDPILGQSVWGQDFPNPVGLAAGFDKNAEAIGPLLRQGFGFVEIGSVTPLPQPGNPRPRLFRLPEDEAVINRLGFNSDGMEDVARRLAARRRAGIVGVNLGKNKDTEDAALDYALGAARLAPFADYLVCNLSSPNTPGLRALQQRDALGVLVGRVKAAIAASGASPPLVVKVAPDLGEGEAESIAEVALDMGVAGLIVANTTIARPQSLRSGHRGEAGGLSGRPLFAPSTALLARFYRLTGGRLPLVGVGGVASGADAYAKIRAGASLVQLYTALIYRGPGLVARILVELAASLRRDGFASVTQAVGADGR